MKYLILLVLIISGCSESPEPEQKFIFLHHGNNVERISANSFKPDFDINSLRYNDDEGIKYLCKAWVEDYGIPCINSCMEENKDIVKERSMAKGTLKINCEEYCNAPAIQTEGFADGTR